MSLRPWFISNVVDFSLRGFAKGETVHIRWQYSDGIGWRTIATVVTSNSSSANLLLAVPSWVPNGTWSVRGDGTVFRQQTNVVVIQGGPGPSGSSVTPATARLTKELGLFALPITSFGLFARRRRRTL